MVEPSGCAQELNQRSPKMAWKRVFISGARHDGTRRFAPDCCSGEGFVDRRSHREVQTGALGSMRQRQYSMHIGRMLGWGFIFLALMPRSSWAAPQQPEAQVKNISGAEEVETKQKRPSTETREEKSAPTQRPLTMPSQLLSNSNAESAPKDSWDKPVFLDNMGSPYVPLDGWIYPGPQSPGFCRIGEHRICRHASVDAHRLRTDGLGGPRSDRSRSRAIERGRKRDRG